MTWILFVGYLAGTCTTVAFLPQVIRTWRTRSTQDISLGMFSLMVLREEPFLSGILLSFLFSLISSLNSG